MPRRLGALWMVVFAAFAVFPGAVPALQRAPLTLAPLPGPGGCVSDEALDAAGHCARPRGLQYSPRSMVVSPDGANLYVISGMGPDQGSLTVFDRDQLTGEVEEADCISATGSGGVCATSATMTGASSVAVSPDLGNVYVASAGNFGLGGGGLVVFERDRGTGAVRLTGCIGDREGCDHSDSQGIAGAVAVSSDGRHVYVGGANGMVIYARDPGDGTVRRTSCVTDGRDPDDGCTHVQPFYGLGLFAPSPDGRHIYAPSDGNAPVTYERDVSTGALSPLGCSAGPSWCASDFGSGPRMLAMSPDGRDLYGVGFSGFMNFAQQKGGSLFGFDREPRSGALTPSQCFGPQISTGPCVPTDKVRDPAGVAAAGDGRGVYVLSGGSDARIGTLTVFQRNPVNGNLDESGCLAQNGSRADCLGAFGLGAARSLAVSPDGRNVYVGAAAQRIAAFGPAVAIDASTVQVGRRGGATLALVCPHAAGTCGGALELRTVAPVRVRSGRRGRARRLTLATSRFSVRGGRRTAVRLHLSRAGNQLLHRSRSLSTRATLTGSGSIAAKTVQTLTLRARSV